MADSEKQSFWSTVPGILTGVAALLTAAGGFWISIHNGHTDSASGQPKPAPIVEGDAPARPSITTPSVPLANASAASTSAPDAGKQSTVTVRSRAGETTDLTLKSFHHNYTDDGIELTSGQTIKLDKLNTIDFLEVNGDAHQVAIHITLVDGRTVDGSLATNYAFKGDSDLGSFTIFVQDVKQIVFHR